MKNIRALSENFLFLELKFSIYLNRCVFVILFIVIDLLYIEKKNQCSSYKYAGSSQKRNLDVVVQ